MKSQELFIALSDRGGVPGFAADFRLDVFLVAAFGVASSGDFLSDVSASSCARTASRGGASRNAIVPPALSIFARAAALILSASTFSPCFNSPPPRIFIPTK